MKIFHWEDVDVLRQHSSGEVIVTAETKEEAVRLAVQEYGPDDCADVQRGSWETLEALEAELKSKEPKVLEAPVVFLILGSA